MSRKRSSPAEDVMDLVALLPWWVGVTLAVVFYFVLHAFSKPPDLAGAATPSAVVSQAPRIIYAQLAAIGQYLLPFLCLLGAAVSFLRRRKRTSLIQGVASKGGPALDVMSWREFEWTVGEAFRLDGYSVAETGGGGPDGGVDLVLRKAGKTYLVQCKQRRNGNVDVATVREIAGVMGDKAAHGAFVVTSGRFTPDAEAFARRNNIELVDRDGLVARVPCRAGDSQAPSMPPVGAPAPREAAIDRSATAPLSPSCPKCGSEMVKRQARTGSRAGSYFWGCSTYPKCHSTMNIAGAAGAAG